MAASIAVYEALSEPGGLVLLLSPSLRQSQELFKKILATYAAAGRPVPAESETALTLTLGNGSRILSLPGLEKTIRGFSGVRLLLVDEASRVEDELIGGITPMLATTNGSLIALTTPAGKIGWFYDMWIGADDWTRVRESALQSAHAFQKSFLLRKCDG